jgi:riboflavin synthase alpha subunit
MKRKSLKKTPTEKAALALARRTCRETYAQALSEAQAVILDQATLLRERFGGHSIEYYYEEIMQKSRFQRERGVSQWNAFVNQEAKRINGGKVFYIMDVMFSSSQSFRYSRRSTSSES